MSRKAKDWGPLEEATGEPMQTSGLTLWQDGDQEVGVWECTPGPSYWKLETNEFVHVLSGRVRLSAGQHSWDGRHGDLLMLPDAPHSLEALEDSAVLLTVAKQV